MANSTVPLVDRIGLSPSEAGELVGLSRKLIDRATETGELPYSKVGSRTIILRSSLDAWLKEKERERSRAIADMSDRCASVE